MRYLDAEQFKSLCPCQNWELMRNLVNSQFFVAKKLKLRISSNSKNASEPTVLTNCEVQSMRMKMVCDDRTLREVANEFLALKKAQKVRERTLNDYKSTSTSFLNNPKTPWMWMSWRLKFWITSLTFPKPVLPDSIIPTSIFMPYLHGRQSKTTSPTTPSRNWNWRKCEMKEMFSLRKSGTFRPF